MKVYHASDVIVDFPDIHHSRDALDYGIGFYVTALLEQAVKYAKRFKFRGQKAYLNIYELDENGKDSHVKVFRDYNEEWLDFITANKSLKTAPRYDAMEGGVANDKIFRTIELYLAGDVSKAEALRRLKSSIQIIKYA